MSEINKEVIINEAKLLNPNIEIEDTSLKFKDIGFDSLLILELIINVEKIFSVPAALLIVPHNNGISVDSIWNNIKNHG